MENKKIAIITITSGTNFGNRLQNYALQTYLKNMFGINAETLINNSETLKSFLKKVITFFFVKRKKSMRDERFEKFNKDNINFSKIKINNFYKNFKLKKYDYLICGSDQIWNSTFSENDRANFGYFYKKQKVVSYSASFGVDKIVRSKQAKYRKYLNNLKYISVREDAGREIVEELTGRKDVEVLIDPTMLLTAKEWDYLAKRPKQLDDFKGKKYILCYFLGKPSTSRKKEIERIAKENNCNIINILDCNDPFYTCDPSEFLYLEKNAFLICTDSFHSSIFAIIYDRPFVIFDREQKNYKNMNSRIDTLIKKFKLKDRKYNGKKITEDNLYHNYTDAYVILEEERKKSKKYLEKALDLKMQVKKKESDY